MLPKKIEKNKFAAYTKNLNKIKERNLKENNWFGVTFDIQIVNL